MSTHDFTETDHPRSGDGRFSPKPAAAESAVALNSQFPGADEHSAMIGTPHVYVNDGAATFTSTHQITDTGDGGYTVATTAGALQFVRAGAPLTDPDGSGETSQVVVFDGSGEADFVVAAAASHRASHPDMGEELGEELANTELTSILVVDRPGRAPVLEFEGHTSADPDAVYAG